MNKKDLLNEQILKIKKYINMLENYETTNAEREDNVVSKVSYPVFEEDTEMNEIIDELENLDEMYDETGISTPYGEDNGVITPKFVEESLSSLAKQHHIDLSKYDMGQIEKGMKVEMEHKNVTSGNKSETLKIVIAHLDEDPKYYDKLDKVEKMNEKHLDTPEEHDMFDQQVKIQNLLNILTSNKPELKQLLQILYENGLYFKLLKLRSGKDFDSKDQIISDVKSYIEKLDDFDTRDDKSKMLQIINTISSVPMSEDSCGCDEMMNENVKTVSSLIMEALDKSTKYSSVEKLVSLVLYSQIQAQNYHRQTKSLSEHNALKDYYSDIADIIDGFIESYQGKHGIIKKYTGFKPLVYKDNANTIKYFQNLYNKIDSLRKSVKESYLQNQIDEIQELIELTIYKLNYLK